MFSEEVNEVRQELPLDSCHSLVLLDSALQKQYNFLFELHLDWALEDLKKRKHLFLNCIRQGSKERISHELAKKSPAIGNDLSTFQAVLSFSCLLFDKPGHY